MVHDQMVNNYDFAVTFFSAESLLRLVFVDVVEAEGEDLEDNLNEDFFPVLFFLFHRQKCFFLYRSKKTQNYPKIIFSKLSIGANMRQKGRSFFF